MAARDFHAIFALDVLDNGMGIRENMFRMIQNPFFPSNDLVYVMCLVFLVGRPFRLEWKSQLECRVQTEDGGNAAVSDAGDTL
ncbi:hypothetical protein C404_16045 [Ralstonia sp. AU12-08]|nr:hypothetical protein C404_16045 [Ralstonia sp. AU12-08]